MGRHPTTATEQALRGRCATGATGRLTVGAGAGEVSVYLLDGEAVAVRAADDAAVLVDRLATRGDLTDDRARELQAMQTMAIPILGREGSDPILGLLLDQLDDHVLDDVLGTRFDEVLLGFLTSGSEPSFTPDTPPWGHLVRTVGGTPSLVDGLLDAQAAAASLDPKRLVAVGGVEPLDLVEAALVAPLVSGPRPVIDVVERLAAPLVLTMARVARALERGVLVDADVPSLLAPLGPAPEPASGDALPDEELEAFSGTEDERRGGSRDGTFVQDARTLDRVELVHDEVGQEPTFSAPSLSEEDAVDKIDVANGVLRAVFAALAGATGPREARAALQVLVDGRPRPFVPLLDGVVVGESGDLPLGPLMANLRRRLPTEQRHLLNQGLLDLLDRTLDRVADELPDDAFDDLLEQVLGYRQRLGL